MSLTIRNSAGKHPTDPSWFQRKDFIPKYIFSHRQHQKTLTKKTASHCAYRQPAKNPIITNQPADVDVQRTLHWRSLSGTMKMHSGRRSNGGKQAGPFAS
jgi:hypothetical protein